MNDILYVGTAGSSSADIILLRVTIVPMGYCSAHTGEILYVYDTTETSDITEAECVLLCEVL